jgi:3D (Asp-Asp-Asp) domain-containing protein
MVGEAVSSARARSARGTRALAAFALLAIGCSGAIGPHGARELPAPDPAPTADHAARVPDAAPPAPAPQAPETPHLVVTATAYNSLPSQGVGSGQIGAWGDRLRPGMKTIAVSADLLALGLTRGAKVRIEGLDGHYVVLDRLPKRWSRRIDIYMGKDVRAARQWGKRDVRIWHERDA